MLSLKSCSWISIIENGQYLDTELANRSVIIQQQFCTYYNFFYVYIVLL